MGFYDSYNFEGTKLFSKLKDKNYWTLAEPSKHFLSIINQLKSSTPAPESLTVAEIGIGIGATSLQVLKLLDEGGTYYGFDFDNVTEAFLSDLQVQDFGIKCNIVMKGNSHSPGDSYNWNLSNMIFEMRERHEAGVFDAVYLDGAHTFLYTGIGVCLLKELIKEGGYLILDDLFWTQSKSKTVRDIALKNKVPKEQMDDMQVLRAQEIFLSNDPNWEKLSSPKDKRGVFRKRIKE